jgi:hypothetical protein
MVDCPRPEVTRLVPSHKNRFFMSCVRWSGLMTEVFRSFPIRQVPSRCTENCCSFMGSVHFFLGPGWVEEFECTAIEPLHQFEVMLPMGNDFRGFTDSLSATACRFARLPGGSRLGFPPANGDFYTRAFSGSVTLPVVEHNYGGN